MKMKTLCTFLVGAALTFFAQGWRQNNLWLVLTGFFLLLFVGTLGVWSLVHYVTLIQLRDQADEHRWRALMGEIRCIRDNL